MPTKQDQIDSIYQELINFEKSPLYEYRLKNNYQPVVGEGSLNAEVVFIGEAPGETEAKTGRPFAGAAGKVLDSLLATIKLSRSHVYITNIVNDRPPGNRDPLPEEIDLYSPFLLRILKTIQPQVIATLGRFSMQYMLDLFHSQESGKKISQLHGRTFPVETSYGKITLIPLYHPAVALYNASQRKTLETDFETLSELLSEK